MFLVQLVYGVGCILKNPNQTKLKQILPSCDKFDKGTVLITALSISNIPYHYQFYFYICFSLTGKQQRLAVFKSNIKL